MEYIHEVVTTTDIPVNIFLSGVKAVQKHWHNSIELLLVLHGEVHLQLEREAFLLQQDDFVIINSNQIHSLQAEDEANVVLTFQFPKAFLTETGIDTQQVCFRCNSQRINQEELLGVLRSLIAEITISYLKKERFYEIKVKELLYRLLYYFTLHFIEEKPPEKSSGNVKDLDRLSLAINEIRNQYQTSLTLNAVAEVQGLSRNYFANFFKKHMGVTFLEYLNGVRLEHAYDALVYTNHSVTQIALDNGFPSGKAFTKGFKDVFGETPYAYRMKYREKNKQKPVKKTASSVSYFEIEGTQKYQSLYRYFREPKAPISVSTATYHISKEINTEVKGKKLCKNPFSLLTFGRASTALGAPLQNQLTQVQKDMNFEYVRFHGLLDDDMQVYREDKNGNPIYNFRLVNYLLDFLISVRLKPFLELAFMPSALAKGKEQLWEGKSIISMPKDMAKWEDLLRNLLKNLIHRYGRERVCTWKFELWNEPEYQGIMWHDTQADYLALWESTYHTVKEMDAKIEVGGPACFIETVSQKEWFQPFAQHCKSTGTTPDFLSVHFYPLEGLDIYRIEKWQRTFSGENRTYQSVSENWSNMVKNTTIKLSGNPNLLQESYHQMIKNLAVYQWEKLPIYLTEWNSTIWQKDLISDTSYKSAYIVSNIVNNLDSFAGFGYWSLSDCMEELPLDKHIFHGGFGLVTAEGVQKASYHGLSLLTHIGNYLVEKGGKYCVFKSKEGIQVLLYHYCHPNALYRKFDVSGITSTDRGMVFEEDINIQINLSLQVAEAGEYDCKETYVSTQSGSSYDEWVRMGAPEALTEQEAARLNSISQPKMKVYRKTAKPSLEISRELEPNEVVLIEIKKKK